MNANVAEFTISKAHLSDAAALHRIYEGSPDYFALLGTEEPTAQETELELGLALMDSRRHVELIRCGGEAAGLLDWKEAYPEPQDVTLNLLLLTPAHRRAGLGSAALQDLEGRLQGTAARRLMASVLGENPDAAHFLQRLGYRLAVHAGPAITWYAKPLGEQSIQHYAAPAEG